MTSRQNNQKTDRPGRDETRFRQEAKALQTEMVKGREAAAAAMIKYYSFLHDVELDVKRWGKGGWERNSFTEILTLIGADISEYRNFLKCKEVIGSLAILSEVGVEAASVVADIPASAMSKSVPTKKARDQALMEVMASAKSLKGPVSRQKAWEIRKVHHERSTEEETPSARYQKQIRDLKAENKKLQAQVSVLEKENRSLREQLNNARMTGPVRKAVRGQASVSA